MAEDAKKPDLKVVDAPEPESVFDDIETLRKTAAVKVTRRVIAVNVVVKKPPNTVFFRCHPDPAMSLDASIIVGDGGSDDYYYVTPRMLNHPVILPRLRRVTITTVYSWPGGVVSLWPVPKADETRIACWKSARTAYDLSKEKWVQLCWNADRRDYDVAVADGIKTEPNWPEDLNLSKLLKLGFAGKIIDSPEHDYVKQLRGIAE
jgi:hypothetical protein